MSIIYREPSYGGIGRREGLKIPWTVMSVQVRVLLRGHKNNGKLAEWFIAPVLKTGDRLTAIRGSKSLTFRILIIFYVKMTYFWHKWIYLFGIWYNGYYSCFGSMRRSFDYCYPDNMEVWVSGLNQFPAKEPIRNRIRKFKSCHFRPFYRRML